MDYDYIIVGSGAGGGPLAARLAESGFNVLLLEAGLDGEGILEQVPAFHTSASEDERITWSFFVRHYADETRQQRDWKYVPCKDKPGRGGIYYPRAATLGGCTQHHAMIVVRPHNSDWDGIAALTGDPSWAAKRMQRYFKRMERCEHRPFQRLLHRLLGWSPSGHGFDGWLPTTVADPKLVIGDKQIAEIIIDSAHYALGHTRSRLPFWIGRLVRTLFTLGDPNDWRAVKRHRVGVRQVPLSVENGRRRGVPERLRQAEAAHPRRLAIRTGAQVTRLLFESDELESTRVVGVEYLDGAQLYCAAPEHREQTGDVPRVQVRATREVVLCGGAFNTPQLLQLSGIGPADVLAAAGVPLRLDLPGVGANLQDRLEVGVVFRVKEPFTAMAGATMTPDPEDPHFRAWQQGEGIYTTNGVILGIIDRSSHEHLDPDLFMFGLLTDFRGYYPGYSQRVRDSRRYLTWAILKAHTRNTAGRVAIRSSDPLEPPAINFHYLGEGNVPEQEDLDAIVSAIRRLRKMVGRYADLIDAELVPGPGLSDPDPGREYQLLADFVRDESWGHHACGTCRISADADPMAVLDSRFRVRGTNGLRVVDASVFPHIPGLFLVAPVYMIAEKAADVIIEDAGGRGRRPARNRSRLREESIHPRPAEDLSMSAASQTSAGHAWHKETIFSPLQFRNLTSKNRLFRSNISGMFDDYNGHGGNARINWEEQFARGGVGTIISSYCPVAIRGRILTRYATIDNDDKIPFWRLVAERVHRWDCRFVMQLSHSGRQQDLGGVENLYHTKLSSTNNKDFFHGLLCRAMTQQEIHEVVGQFAAGARRAREAGLDGVELHGANGYLITQFLSSGINDRTDDYGGPVANRARFALEIVRAIRKECGRDFHLQMKINGVDHNDWLYPWQPKGNSLEENIEICRILEDGGNGVDAFHISSGSTFPHPRNPPGDLPVRSASRWYDGLLSEGVRTRMNEFIFGDPLLGPLFRRYWTFRRGPVIEGINLEYARAVKQQVSVPVLCTGGFQHARNIAEAIDGGACDGVSIARPLIANPDLPKILDRQDGPDPGKECTYCNKCLLNDLENPLGCYELSRYDGADFDERYANMIQTVMSVFDPPASSRLTFSDQESSK